MLYVKSIFFVIHILLVLGFNNVQSQDMKIIYVGDPMCSWCYGFGDQMSLLLGKYPNADFELVMGGLRKDGDEHISTLKEFLKEHWMDVSRTTGVKFNYNILNEDIYYNTEPACRAVTTFRTYNKKDLLNYFRDIQEAFYLNNINPFLTENYAELASKYGVDKKAFEDRMTSDLGFRLVLDDFNRATSLKVSTFPTVFLEYQGMIYLITRGYDNAESMARKIEDLLKKLNRNRNYIKQEP